MNYHETIESVEKKIIPEEMNALYKRMLFLLTGIRNEFKTISLEDSTSFNSYREKVINKGKKEDTLIQLYSLRTMESDLLEKERKLEDKLINGEQITSEEYKILTTLKEKREKITKNKDSILKNIYFSNNNIKKLDNKRVNTEGLIDISRNYIKTSVEELSSIIKKLDEKNLGIERLDGLSVQGKHIDELNSFIYGYGEKAGYKVNIDDTVKNIDDIFKNSLEIRINMFKDIYNESKKIISSYKKHETPDFMKVNEIGALSNSGISEKPYSIYPYMVHTIEGFDKRHLDEFSYIVEQLNIASKGELSKEEVEELMSRIKNENLQTDMTHNWLWNREHNLSQYLSYVKDNAKEVKYTK